MPMKILAHLCTARHAFTIACLLLFACSVAQAQKRDHLTEQEADWVREMQLIDKRIEVFIKAADRRLLVLTKPDTVQEKKEEEKWGPLPKGTKVELLQDYKHILEEAMEKLDDAYERDKKNNLLPKALKKFKEAVERQIAELRSLSPQLKNKKEQDALAEAMEEAETATKGTIQ
ncbi:MAG TPA: hypothetical protein VEF04_14585 [Blastocatellia bacterium]|nr:hypothetical protein [Blastocatellia bacterium]